MVCQLHIHRLTRAFNRHPPLLRLFWLAGRGAALRRLTGQRLVQGPDALQQGGCFQIPCQGQHGVGGGVIILVMPVQIGARHALQVSQAADDLMMVSVNPKSCLLHGLAQAVCADETFVALTARLASPTLSITAPDAARPFAVAALAQATRDPLLVVSASGREAEDLVAELAELLDDPGAVALFPSWETLPHERLSPSADTVGQRLAVLHRLAAPAAPTLRVVVTTVRSVVQPMAPGLGTLRWGVAPWAVQLWDGPGFPLVAASVACAGLSLLLFLLGRPAGTGRRAGKEDHSLAYPRAVIVEGPQRAAGLLLFVVVFLGYPWEGGTGKMLWAGSVLGLSLIHISEPTRPY